MARRYRSTLLAVLFTLVATSLTPAAYAQASNPGIMGPHQKFHGLSYADWEVKWWQEVFAIPADNNPLVAGGMFGQDDGIRFLTGVSGPTTINITIPRGTALFFPIINAECSSLEAWPWYGANAIEQAAVATYFNDLVTDISAEIDGRSVVNLEHYRVETPQYTFSVPDANILGVPGPTNGTSVADGTFLLLSPLHVGVHTIHLAATADLQQWFGPGAFFTIDTTYVVTVTPRAH